MDNTYIGEFKGIHIHNVNGCLAIKDKIESSIYIKRLRRLWVRSTQEEKDNLYNTHFTNYDRDLFNSLVENIETIEEIFIKNMINNNYVSIGYNCPDCPMDKVKLANPCQYCKRGSSETITTITTHNKPYVVYPHSSQYDPCEKCSNNHANGGTGVCNCTLPYMQGTTYKAELGGGNK